eukprot:gene3746-2642_t
MGRNKKKSKAAHVASESETDEREEEEAPATPTNAVEQHVDPEDDTLKNKIDCDSDSDNDGDKKKKKKEYKGKKMARQQQGKGKKGGAAPREQAEDGAAAESSSAKNEGADGAGDEDDADALIITREYPMQVLYCPVCTFPAEMCEYSGIMDKCRPWLQEHAAELADAEEKGRKRRVLTEKERLEKLLAGAYSRKHVVTQRIIVELDDHNPKRLLTLVTGMDLFGFNLKDIAREWRKKEPEEKHEQSRLEAQGNVVQKLAKMFVDNYKVPKECVFYVVREGKKKTQYSLSLSRGQRQSRQCSLAAPIASHRTHTTHLVLLLSIFSLQQLSFVWSSLPDGDDDDDAVEKRGRRQQQQQQQQQNKTKQTMKSPINSILKKTAVNGLANSWMMRIAARTALRCQGKVYAAVNSAIDKLEKSTAAAEARRELVNEDNSSSSS